MASEREKGRGKEKVRERTRVREELYQKKNADSAYYTCGNMIWLAQDLAEHLIVQLFRHDDNLRFTRRESSPA